MKQVDTHTCTHIKPKRRRTSTEYNYYRGFCLFEQLFCQKKEIYDTMSPKEKNYAFAEGKEHFMTMTGNLLKRRIAVARGLEPGDVVLKDCRIVDVYTQTIRTGDIVVADGVIAGVGGPYEGREVIEAHGAYAAPGLIEAISISSRLMSARKSSAASSYLWGRRPSSPTRMKSSMSAAWPACAT